MGGRRGGDRGTCSVRGGRHHVPAAGRARRLRAGPDGDRAQRARAHRDLYNGNSFCHQSYPSLKNKFPSDSRLTIRLLRVHPDYKKKTINVHTNTSCFVTDTQRAVGGRGRPQHSDRASHRAGGPENLHICACAVYGWRSEEISFLSAA